VPQQHGGVGRLAVEIGLASRGVFDGFHAARMPSVSECNPVGRNG
jgi:hypothetical protein